MISHAVALRCQSARRSCGAAAPERQDEHAAARVALARRTRASCAAAVFRAVVAKPRRPVALRRCQFRGPLQSWPPRARTAPPQDWCADWSPPRSCNSVAAADPAARPQGILEAPPGLHRTRARLAACPARHAVVSCENTQRHRDGLGGCMPPYERNRASIASSSSMSLMQRAV